ncbi:anti-sigma factor antagonist [Streptomyces sp. NPDC020379]|uniref:STAS domain-containing protein n=1 Tax=Streptomyces sp. NPDC020379 TaxID=3365071 RepID=UPI00378C6AC5
MPTPQMLNIYRHDRKNRALITLAGEIDLASAPLVSETLKRCLWEGIRTIDVDLTPVTFCDCTGLNAFLHAAHRTAEAGGSLRLHYPSPVLARLLALTGTGSLLLALPAGDAPPALPGDPAGSSPAPQRPPRHQAVRRPVPAAPVVPGGAL